MSDKRHSNLKERELNLLSNSSLRALTTSILHFRRLMAYACKAFHWNPISFLKRLRSCQPPFKFYSSPNRSLRRIRCSPYGLEIGPCTTPTSFSKQTSSTCFTITPGPNGSPRLPPSLEVRQELNSLAASANFSGSLLICSLSSNNFAVADSSLT